MNDECELALFAPVVILPSQISVDAQWVSDTSGPIASCSPYRKRRHGASNRGRQRRHPGIRKLAAEAEAWVRCDRSKTPAPSRSKTLAGRGHRPRPA